MECKLCFSYFSLTSSKNNIGNILLINNIDHGHAVSFLNYLNYSKNYIWGEFENISSEYIAHYTILSWEKRTEPVNINYLTKYISKI